jgi:ligand-binding sensor domain-containing protein/signal transduction histidine kinase
VLKLTIAGLISLSFVVSAAAIDPNRALWQYIHDSWGTEKGFPGGSVSAIAQTTDGYLWIGTDEGLIRFDGVNFQRFEQANPGSIAIGPIQALFADGQGNLWILMRNTKLLRYRDGIFNLLRGEAENGITAMGRGAGGAVMLSSLAMGTLTYEGGRFLRLSPAPVLPDSAIVTHGEIPDQRSARLNWSSGVMPDRLAAPISTVISIAATGDGRIWLGTEGGGLYYLSGGRVSAATDRPTNLKVNCLLPVGNSELWVGTNKGVFHWNGSDLTHTGVPLSLLQVEVLSMIRDRDSNIWVGTRRGLLRFNASGVSSLDRSTAEAATAVFEDREGNIWIGGARGLERLRDSTFVTYSVPGSESQSMGPLYVDPKGDVWVAPIEGGLRWLSGGKGESVNAAGLSGDIVYSITGNGHDLWVGRQRGGLTHLRYDHSPVTAETYTDASGLAQNSVNAVHASRDGTVWLGTLSGGVSELRNGHFTNYTTANGLASNTVSSIAEGTDGTMWFGTPNGLSALSKNGWQNYTVRAGLFSPDVNCLLQDSTGTLWIGTAEGLAYFRAGRMQLLEGSSSSLREPIFGIAEDKKGRLWIATARHVLGLERTNLPGGALATTSVREYGLADGLRGTEGVKRYQSVVEDSEGRIWLSTNHGLSVVNPARGTLNSSPAPVHIEAVTVDGSGLDLTGPIRVLPGKQNITFQYVGVSLGNPEAVRYRYRLDGVDRGWSEAVTNREATYGNLGAGTYRFRVMASNSEGPWNGSEAAIGFEIEPAFWQTWWFRASLAAMILLTVCGAYRFHLYQLTSQFNMRLEGRVSERTRIARDLHDTLLQSFHGLLLRFQAVSNLLPARPQEAKQRLDDAIDQAAQAITEGRDAVQGLRSSVTAPNDLALALSRLGQLLRASETSQNPPAFHVEVEGTPRELKPILRDEVYRIVGETLRNAFRHAQARRVEIGIRYDKQGLTLHVIDDGKGIPEELKVTGRPGHWGLEGMRERAKKIGAQLELWSRPEAGTEIELKIPAATAYQSRRTLENWFSSRSSSDIDTQA